VLSIPVPTGVISAGKAIALKLRFPDAARPAEILGGDDSRMLGFSLHRIALFRVETDADATNLTTPRTRSVPLAARQPNMGRPGFDDEQPVVTRLTELTRDVFKRPDLEYHARIKLSDIFGYDSPRFIQFILALEGEFQISLREDEVDSIDTLGDVFALLRGKLPED